MGRWTKARQKKLAIKRGEAGPRPPKPGQRDGRVDYPEIRKENINFETYYKIQNIVPEEEWDAFMQANRSNLPATFRVTGSRAQEEALTHLIQNTFVQDMMQMELSSGVDEGTPPEKEIKIFPLPWYPDNLAWQMNLARTDIRKSEAYCRLHNFLMSETDSGNISRQETVSMIPPVVLQVEPHHKVLDMCAAPGSKTAQILEFLHAGELKIPEGCVIANDLENRRCYMLVHQAKRLQSPALIVTNHDATEYPDIFQRNSDGALVPLKFDRVLCDVPCSGDGTLRKNLALWKKWQLLTAIQLHGVQHRIARRGLELLEVGGLLVYSTCSLNPIENEAVVHRILQDCEGSVELQDIHLPGLKSSPGLSKWVPFDRDSTPYPNFDEIPDMGTTMLRSYHFPPSKADSAKYPLEKCIRVLPHQQDTGGFFIALFKKTKALPWEKVPLPEDRLAIGIPRSKDGKPDKKVARNRNQGCIEDPYIFMNNDAPLWTQIREFYDLDPTVEPSSFLTRSAAEKVKNIYYTTKLLKNIVQSNEGFLKIINTGVKAFARSDNKACTCDYRLASDGLYSMLSYVKSRIVKIPKEDLVILLLNNDKDTPPRIETLSSATQEAVKHLPSGSFVIVVDCKIGEDGPNFTIELIGWRGNSSIRAYVALNERVHYLRMCGQDVSRFEKNKYKEAADAEDGTPSEDASRLEQPSGDSSPSPTQAEMEEP